MDQYSIFNKHYVISIIHRLLDRDHWDLLCALAIEEEVNYLQSLRRMILDRRNLENTLFDYENHILRQITYWKNCRMLTELSKNG